MSKTLSNGVLSLRFMQNAQRAKQLKEVELQRAEVVDEGKWEVSHAVREAWGLTKEENEDRDADVHEASYLPFLYAITDEGSSEDRTHIASGRRVFKHTTLEVPHDADEVTQGKDIPPASTSNDSSKPSKGRIHAHAHPVSISSLSKGKATFLKGFDQLGAKSKEIQVPRPTARDLIFESGNIGVDLREQPSTKAPPPAFMKPAGVDDPKELGDAGSPTVKPSEAETPIIDGARQKSKKTKRVRDQVIDDEEEPAQKKSKKKKKRSGSRG